MKHPAKADSPNLLTLTPAQKAAKAINWSNPVPITAAEEEARAARSQTMRMDFANWKMMQDGLEPDVLRSSYPPGYEVGSDGADLKGVYRERRELRRGQAHERPTRRGTWLLRVCLPVSYCSRFSNKTPPRPKYRPAQLSEQLDVLRTD
jgi:hypothetical protein